MSLTQFCTNFGVTVDGVVPDETDPDAHRYANLTGQMTFWKANLSQITIETARKIVGKAWSVFPKEDQTTKNALTRVGEAIGQLLPLTNLERIDLATGEPIDVLKRPIDPVILDWCNSGEDRWVTIIREKRHSPWIGVWPAMS